MRLIAPENASNVQMASVKTMTAIATQMKYVATASVKNAARMAIARQVPAVAENAVPGRVVTTRLAVKRVRFALTANAS